MAESNVNIDKAVQVFRKIIKRKTIYNETNLHFEYFQIAGDTIPFKDLGYESLKQFIKQHAGDKFYFEKAGQDFEFIAPKRIDPVEQVESEPLSNKFTSFKQMFETPDYIPESESSLDTKKLKIGKHISNSLGEGPSPRKNICVSHNIRFTAPTSTTTQNPSKNIRNDIRISLNVQAKTRAIDCQAMEIDENSAETVPNESLASIEKDATGSDDVDFRDVQYPWYFAHWHMKIKNPVSTNEIWASFSDEFEDHLRMLTLNLTKEITAGKKYPMVCEVNKVFALMIEKQCYRARMLKFNLESGRCKCFLIDIGTKDWYNLTDVFHCPFELREIPPMVIRMKLFNLTELKDNQAARALVVSELDGKEIVARIHTKREEFARQRNKSVTVTLYESARNDSRDISAEIMEKLFETFSAPKLSKRRTNYVIISHISKATGFIYCHLKYNYEELMYLNKLLESCAKDCPELSFRKAESETDLHTKIANNAGKVYLVHYKDEEKWFRATILQLETDAASSQSNTLLEHCFAYCFLVDYGRTRCIPMNKVYELDEVVAKYPVLAIALTLDGVEMSRDKVQDLKQIISAGEKVMVDVIDTFNHSEPNKTHTVSKVQMTRFATYNADFDESDVNKLLLKLADEHC